MFYFRFLSVTICRLLVHLSHLLAGITAVNSRVSLTSGFRGESIRTGFQQSSSGGDPRRTPRLGEPALPRRGTDRAR
ncbi:hypothetical protein BN903_109 [Halorubrum sp. AJ67]|nr:hypothetical protein BN903_109 [Halorubrum sp. AJ67]